MNDDLSVKPYPSRDWHRRSLIRFYITVNKKSIPKYLREQYIVLWYDLDYSTYLSELPERWYVTDLTPERNVIAEGKSIHFFDVHEGDPSCAEDIWFALDDGDKARAIFRHAMNLYQKNNE